MITDYRTLSWWLWYQYSYQEATDPKAIQDMIEEYARNPLACHQELKERFDEYRETERTTRTS